MRIRVVRTPRQRTFCGIEAMESRLMLAANSGTFSALHPLTLQDPKTTNNATFAMAGPGSGTVSVGVNGIWNILLENTSRSTIVTVGGQEVDVEQITAAKMVGALIAPKMDWVAVNTTSHASQMSFQGGILRLQLNDLSAMDGVAHSMTIGLGDRATDATAVTLHDANDLAIDSMMPIASIAANSYTAHGNYRPAIHTTAYFGAITVAHDVTGVNTTGAPARPVFHAEVPNPSNGKGIPNLAVGGSLTNVTIYTDAGNIGPVTISGEMNNASVYTGHGSLAKAFIGQGMRNGSELYSTNGNFAGVTVAGSLDDSMIYADGIANLGPVWIGGSVNNSSRIHAGTVGNLNTVTIAGSLNHSDVYTGSGNIVRVSVGQGMTNSAKIHLGDGALKAVSIAGDVSVSSSIYVSGTGVLSSVTITGSLNDSNVYSSSGDLTRVAVGGSVTNGAEIRTGSGNLGLLAIAHDLDGGSTVSVSRGTVGLKKMTVAGSIGAGVTVDVSNAMIGSLAVDGGIIGAGATRPERVSITADAGIASLTVGQDTKYLSVSSTYGPIKSVKIARTMQNSDIGSDAAITIGSVTVGQLDASRISTGLATNTPTRQRSDFQAAGTITRVSVTGVVTDGVRNFMTSNSVIASWFLGKVVFAAHSTGSGVIEFHTGTVVNAPVSSSQQSLFTLIA